MRNLAAARGGKLLSETCTRMKEHLQWQCSSGHTWWATVGNIKSRGSWCPDCSQTRPLNLQIAQETARRRGGECLSEIYGNRVMPLRWRCDRGHEWHACLASVRTGGSWCPICAGKQRLTLELAQDLARRNGGVLLSIEYVNNRAPMSWQCTEGHRWSASLNSVKDSGSWCPGCARQKRLLGLQVARDVAASRKGLCLSALYVTSSSALTWQFDSQPPNIQEA